MSKYKAIKTKVDGIIFDSKKEAVYYSQLLLQKKCVTEKYRVIKIELQPRFNYEIKYHANGLVYKKTAFYKADFRVTYADNRIEIIDVKGCKKGHAYQTFKRKKKIIETLYQIEIIEK